MSKNNQGYGLMRFLILGMSLVLLGCENHEAPSGLAGIVAGEGMSVDMSRLDFECVHESIPSPSDDSDVVFQYARWTQKGNQLKNDEAINLQVERLYRISAEHGHVKANVNLQNGGLRGQFQLTDADFIRMSQQLIDRGVATGYHFVSVFLSNGLAGLAKDEEMALRFQRKAADTGSAVAQYIVAEKLAPIDRAPAVARKMRQCAAQQGHEKAALALGVDLSTDGLYDEAIEAFQLGVAAGSSTSASFIKHGFLGPPSEDRLNYLGQQKDLVRAERYEKIWRILANYSYANPKVPEINDIVPLPPAPLPEWDGKLQWLEERLANVPPPKPDEALIIRLAKEKGLDPKTGKPLPGSPAFYQANFPVMFRYSGEVCPESGHWKVIWPPGRNVLYRQVTRHFEQEQVFPSQRVDRFHLRPWPFSDKRSSSDEPVEWGLLG